MWYAFWADVIVGVHLAYVGYVIVGQLLIVAGLLLGWGWVRNPWFRITHLLAILIVAFETVCGITCPLTTWEAQLREAAGQSAAEGTFIGRLMHDVLFVENVNPTVLNACYLGVALLIVGTFAFGPPRFRRRAASEAPAAPAFPTMTPQRQPPVPSVSGSHERHPSAAGIAEPVGRPSGTGSLQA